MKTDCSALKGTFITSAGAQRTSWKTVWEELKSHKTEKGYEKLSSVHEQPLQLQLPALPKQSWNSQQPITNLGGAHGALLSAALVATESPGERQVNVFSCVPPMKPPGSNGKSQIHSDTEVSG